MSLAAAVLCVLLASPARAMDEPFFKMSEPEIASALKALHRRHPRLSERVAAVSERFLGTPYKLGPLGEGEDGEFDRDPLVSFKQADCTTLVEQVMALSLKPELPAAVATLQSIRYKDGRVGFATRNHFPEADWIARNVGAGYLKDITRDVAGAKTQRARKLISKRQWYTSMSTANLEGFSPEERLARLPRLRALGERFEDQEASIDYLPMDGLPQALAGVPSGALANLVREDLPDKPVLISHQVLLIDKDGIKYVRHAAYGKTVEDVPALEYFYRYFNSKWRLVGLNLNLVRDPSRPAD